MVTDIIRIYAGLLIAASFPVLAAPEKTIELHPAQDTQIRQNYGTYPSYAAGNTFQVYGPDFQGLIRFDLDTLPGNVTSATLKIPCRNAASTPHTVYLESNDAWKEAEVTWADWFRAVPASVSARLGEWTPVNGVLSMDITEAAKSENLSPGRAITLRIAATPDGTQPVSYGTRENEDKPTLQVTCDAAPPSAKVFALSSQQEIRNALATAKPGQTFTLADGVYQDLKVSMEVSGTPEEPITLQALHPGQAKLTGASHVALRGDYLVLSGLVFDRCIGGTVVNLNGASHSRITDCAFFDCGKQDSPFSHLIEDTNGAAFNRFDHLYMTGNLGMGIGIRVHPWNQGNTDHLIERNWFHNIAPAPGGNGRESIQLGQGGPYKDPKTGVLWDTANPPMDNLTRTTIQCNLFLAARGDPEITSLKAGENIVRYNTIRDCTNQTICSRGGIRNRIEGNFIFNSRGIRAFGSDHVIINNYIDGTTEGIWLGGGGKGYAAARNVLLAHNTVINGWQKALLLGENWAEGGEAPSGRILNNIFQVAKDKTPVNLWSPSMDLGKITWSGNIGWRPSASKGRGWGYAENFVDAQMKLVDPLFSASSDHGLKRFDAKSPACDAVKDSLLPEIAKDIDGQDRKAPSEIGADEVQSSGVGTVTNVPLTPAEVGPTWMSGDPSSVIRVQ